ncbi:ATP-binding cassette domain-containing protein [Candidatus Palauibacter polyketidifaciens]|uniref:ATP-binding cassette domain-containing protein n=1 Tax=Candidatus Palauibacter polyketidifaciens TaxID=3056740 RepID=UPI00238A19B1|nr:ATP-binding cassette domain-containing protein [Candidatus Palauibacter polyketidifaciens]MDE2719963.1 ATP-binding cassette domain-containing protein [Candidatus Palauibacter polyketidifaciens]
MSLAVAAEGVTRRFGRRWALRGVDFAVPRGAVVALLGANGTGKTTLLRLISTLLKPTAGRLEVLGYTLPAGGDEIRTGAAFMTAGGHAYEELTGVENLRFAARMSGTATTDDDLRDALAAADLGGAADLPVRGWSTGMRKRLELARLRLRPLELVLLDEPFVSLDEDGVGLVHEAVRGWRDAGAAVVIASHRVEDATRHADDVVRLAGGRVADVTP